MSTVDAVALEQAGHDVESHIWDHTPVKADAGEDVA